MDEMRKRGRHLVQYFCRCVRTNNDIEGWHNSLNRRAGGRVHLPFYLLIQLLHRESSVYTVQVRLVNARKLQRIQRKKYRALQARIFGYWEDYSANVFSIGVYYGTSVLTLCFSISPSCALLLRNTCQVCMISVPHGSKVS